MTQQPQPMPAILLHFDERGRITQEALRETGFHLNRTVWIDTARCASVASRKLLSAGMACRAGELGELRIKVKKRIEEHCVHLIVAHPVPFFFGSFYAKPSRKP
jgi:hypothetical protein